MEHESENDILFDMSAESTAPHRNFFLSLKGLLSILFIAVVIVSAWYFAQPSAEASEKRVEIKWLLAHQPADVFERAADVLAQVLAEESGGTMTLQVLVPSDLGYNGDVPSADVFALLESGEIQLSSTYVVGMGEKDPMLGIVNLPYLFKDYDSAGAVLEGPIGAQLLDGFAKNTPEKAFAFTYSGGFRILVSKDTPIRSAADLKGLRVATAGGPVAEAMYRELGAIPVSVSVDGAANAAEVGGVDAVETTYSRIASLVGKSTYIRYISETNHSLFLTSIITNSSFYNSLPPEQQRALSRAVEAAAQVEREDSIALGAQARATAQGKGITIVTPSADEYAELIQATKPVYSSFDSLFGKDTVEAIRNAQ